MKALLCKINWLSRYHGEVDDNVYEKSNFINFDGIYYGYIHAKSLEHFVHQHHTIFDYVIFYATHETKGDKIVGWYKNAIVFRDEQLFDPDCPYFVRANEDDVVLLSEEDRHFSINAKEVVSLIEITKSLDHYLKRSKRINYRRSDLQLSSTMNLPSLQKTCEFIEQAMVEEKGIQALQLVNKGLRTYGNLASLLYYKAWILYSFAQYRVASTILHQIMNVNEMHEFACYVLGNINFQTADYQTAIQYFKEVKKINKDECCYMISQSYAMLSNSELAILYVKKALEINPQRVYQDYYENLIAWQNDINQK